MTNFKKITSAAAAIMIAATMMAGTVAFAASDSIPDTTTQNYTISVNANTRSSYKVYQLLTGKFETPNGESQKVIVDAKTGSSVKTDTDVDDVLAALVGADGKAKVTKNSVNELKALVKADEPITTLSAVETSVQVPLGYYLVIEEQDPDKAAILMIVDNDLNIASKLGAVTFEKKLKDINDSADNDITDNDWQDGADHDIGDYVPFMLKATLPENVDQYDGYYLQFTDNISPAFNVKDVADLVGLAVGIDTNNDGIVDEDKLFNKNADNEKGFNKGYDISVTENSFTITIPDVKHLGATNDSVIVVNYSAKLGVDSYTGDTDPNENIVNYGAAGNPNEASATYSNNPEFDMYPNAGPGEDVGDTTDENDKPGTPDENNREETEKDKVIVFTYKTVINKVDKDGKPLDGAEFKLSKMNAAGNYEEVNRKIFEGTVFKFYGLDDGEYKLEEVETPDGYKGIDPINFTVLADHDDLEDDPKLKDLTADGLGEDGDPVTGNINTGIIETSIENTKGSKLPETGGIGTKLFYAVGGGLAGLAGIALITKKRMSKKN
ncbi:SpaA isopeptide-forming pilin-related protein [uncultured Ruminococcus sp.]|uniref:SpaA isopeptide-forming pilin-related protein n=1 Tax=uncultured Ruminococcus sp. TaxID=165186 RepID=UPI0025D0954A|nr:SpaA isopeptide-forming pilin-related protein [uncultured Ruminococcus sp.]